MTTLVGPIELTEVIKTKHEAVNFVEQLQRVNELLYTVSGTFEEKTQEALPYQKKTYLVHLLTTHQIDTSDMSSVQEFLKQLIDLIRNLPVVTITVAIEPNEQTIGKILSWLRINVDKTIILETQVDSHLVGGITLGWQGKYADLSVKSKMDQINNENEINLLK